MYFHCESTYLSVGCIICKTLHEIDVYIIILFDELDALYFKI